MRAVQLVLGHVFQLHPRDLCTFARGLALRKATSSLEASGRASCTDCARSAWAKGKRGVYFLNIMSSCPSKTVQACCCTTCLAYGFGVFRWSLLSAARPGSVSPQMSPPEAGCCTGWGSGLNATSGR